MILCEQCPDNPTCRSCLDQLKAGDSAQKVSPPRFIGITHIATDRRHTAQLRAISRLAIGIFLEGTELSGRYEVELAADFRIIGGIVQGIRNLPYYVLDIEKVLRKEEVLDRLLVEEFRSWNLTHELEPSVILDVDGDDMDDGRRKLIKQELSKLSILRQIEEIYMYLREGEQIRPLGHFRVHETIEEAVNHVAKRAIQSNAAIREQIISDQCEQIYDVHALPLSDNTCGVAVINITEAIAMERERQQKEWELYKHVLSVVTEERLILLRDDELYEMIRSGENCFTLTLQTAQDLARLREALREAIAPYGLSSKTLLQYTVAVNEAASNTLKHGTGGTISLYLFPTERVCRTVVYDQGRGILLEDLPRAMLKPGFSTKQSLGVGFQVMLTFTDRVWLNSSAVGTKLVLDVSLTDKTR